MFHEIKDKNNTGISDGYSGTNASPFCCVVWIQRDTAEKCPEVTDGSGI